MFPPVSINGEYWGNENEPLSANSEETALAETAIFTDTIALQKMLLVVNSLGTLLLVLLAWKVSANKVHLVL